jgi:hypothetical protein
MATENISHDNILLCIHPPFSAKTNSSAKQVNGDKVQLGKFRHMKLKHCHQRPMIDLIDISSTTTIAVAPAQQQPVLEDIIDVANGRYCLFENNWFLKSQE